MMNYPIENETTRIDSKCGDLKLPNTLYCFSSEKFSTILKQGIRSQNGFVHLYKNKSEAIKLSPHWWSVFKIRTNKIKDHVNNTSPAGDGIWQIEKVPFEYLLVSEIYKVEKYICLCLIPIVLILFLLAVLTNALEKNAAIAILMPSIAAMLTVLINKERITPFVITQITSFGQICVLVILLSSFIYISPNSNNQPSEYSPSPSPTIQYEPDSDITGSSSNGDSSHETPTGSSSTELSINSQIDNGNLVIASGDVIIHNYEPTPITESILDTAAPTPSPEPTNETETLVATSETQDISMLVLGFKDFSNEDVVEVLIKPNGLISDDRFLESVSVISERAAATSEKYYIEAYDREIHLTILKSSLSSNEYDYRAMNKTLDIICKSVGNIYFCSDSGDSFELSRTDFIKAEIDEQFPEGKALLITLTDYGSKQIDNLINMNEKVSMWFDIYASPKYSFSSIFKYQGNTYALINENLQKKSFYKTVQAVLTSSPLPCTFSYSIVDKIVWETADDYRFWGEYQVDENALEDENAYVIYEPSYSDQMDEVMWNLAVSIFKKRLDSFFYPYAFGTGGITGHSIAIKIPVDIVGPDINTAICTNANARLYIGSEFFSIDNLRYLVDGNGNFTLIVSLSSFYQDKCLEILSDGEKTSYIKICDIVIAESVISSASDLDNLRFDSLYFDDTSEISELYQPFLSFLSYVVNDQTQNLPLYSVKSSTFETSDSNSDVTVEYGIQCYTSSLKRLYEYQQANDEISAIRRDGDSITVLIDIPINNELPVKFLNIVEDIITYSEIDNSYYNSITFVLNDEDYYNNERCRVFFSRYNYTAESLQELFQCRVVVFYGNRLDKYIDQLKEQILSMPFYINRDISDSDECLCLDKSITDTFRFSFAF